MSTVDVGHRTEPLTMKAVDVGNKTDDLWIQTTHSPLLDGVNSIIACLGVLGNGMVITVMLLRRRVFSSFTNRLILHQSVIDCVTCVVFFLWRVVFQNVYKNVSLEGNIYDQLICRFIYVDYFLWCLDVTSTCNLVMISLERFMATCHPVKHRNTWTPAKLKFAVATAWAIGFIYGSHFVFMFEARQGRCRFVELKIGWKIFEASAVITVEYLVPIIILIYTYSRIFIVIKKSANLLNGPRNFINKAKKNILVTTMLISIMFVVCWTPIEVFYVCAYISGIWGGWLYATFTGLLACNMFVNPIIYCFKYEHFRSELKSLVIRRCRTSRVGDGEAIPIPAATP
ncbi:galanin receptor 2b-like [Patiria miniata]|uniref:G-protein coupled receptors family 1 profile domain-containing protein n=1 Tax=Patiria miniata TaxID=46514 RepID=A0A914AZ54_PATMI|nr:galanin receptor 2b-like [Patiria miniata]